MRHKDSKHIPGLEHTYRDPSFPHEQGLRTSEQSEEQGGRERDKDSEMVSKSIRKTPIIIELGLGKIKVEVCLLR